jgi:hypothetical protein
VKIDYGLEKDEVYLQVAKNMLFKGGNLDVLGACHLVNNENNNWRKVKTPPSWVPDWSSSGKYIPLRLQGTVREKYFQFAASGIHTRCIPRFLDSQTLSLKGILFDQVTSCSLPAITRNPPPEGIPDGLIVIITDWFQEMYRTHIMIRSIERLFDFGSHEVKYITGESMFNVYWQTLICGCYEPEEYEALHSFFHANTKVGNWRHCPPSLIPRNSAPGVWLYALAHIMDLFWHMFKVFVKFFWVCATGWARTDKKKGTVVDTLISGKQEHMAYGQWRFVKTKKGYVGIAPGSTRPGDWVSVLVGGKVPLVLRRAEDSEGWSLVGESYIHGIMQGEAFDENSCIDINII